LQRNSALSLYTKDGNLTQAIDLQSNLY